MNIGKHGQGTHCAKMGADSSAENTPNAPEFICPICLPNSKSSRFQWKRLHWASVVRGIYDYTGSSLINWVMISNTSWCFISSCHLTSFIINTNFWEIPIVGRILNFAFDKGQLISKVTFSFEPKNQMIFFWFLP